MRLGRDFFFDNVEDDEEEAEAAIAMLAEEDLPSVVSGDEEDVTSSDIK